MRHDVKASLRPQPQFAAPIGRGRARRRRMALRGLLALPIALMLLAPGTSAFATEATTGYSQTTPPPTTTTVTTTTTTTTPTTPTPTSKTTPATKTEPTPKGGVSPSSTSSTPKTTAPASSNEPAKSSTEPTTTAAKATTLPFTGLDLRWVVLAGVLLVGLGMSIMVAQRSRRGPER
jgi:outer membrane biosynthesis protein TonB